MRPNTLILGFYDDRLPKDKLVDPALAVDPSASPRDAEREPPLFHFASLRGSDGGGEPSDGKVLGAREYVAIIADAMKMLKNVVLARDFNGFDRARVLSPPGVVFVDVWPVNLLRPDSCSYVDTCSLFLLQLACILTMVRAWRRARLRLFLCVEAGRSVRGSEQKLGQLLKELRIKAQVFAVPWDQQVALHWQRQAEGAKKPAAAAEEEGDYVNSFPSNATRLSDAYLSAVNRLILDAARPAPAVRFLYLPRPPRRHQPLRHLPAAAGAADPRPRPHAAHPRGHARHHHRPLRRRSWQRRQDF